MYMWTNADINFPVNNSNRPTTEIVADNWKLSKINVFKCPKIAFSLPKFLRHAPWKITNLPVATLLI